MPVESFADGAPLAAWIGRTEVVSDVIVPTPYAALAATLGRDAAPPATGTPLPPLWHWLYFLPLVDAQDIGPDGHALRGGFLPPVQLPRRMWAGGRFVFHSPLRVGDAVTRTSTIESVSAKQGRSGALVFVTVRHDVRRDVDGELAISEHHDIVYRDPPKPGASASGEAALASGEPASASGEPAPASATWQRRVTPDPVLLFRYSALTFNGHRIHYDRDYATGVEGYPGLVVHGPLLSTLLVELVRTHRPAGLMTRFDFRARRPIFDPAAFTVCGEPDTNGRDVRLWIRDADGMLAMDATAKMCDAG